MFKPEASIATEQLTKALKSVGPALSQVSVETFFVLDWVNTGTN
jgi:hypothetical protein